MTGLDHHDTLRGPGAPGRAGGPRQARVVLATGDERLRSDCRDHLTGHGYSVATAAGGVGCLALLREFLPDVVVLDADLLWGGSEGVLAHLRSLGARVPVVLLGTRSPAAARCGPDDTPPVVRVLDQPVGSEALLRAVRVAEGRARTTPVDHNPAAGGPGAGDGARPTPRPVVLVVDDTDCVRHVVRAGLGRQGFDVLAVGDGRHSLALYHDLFDWERDPTVLLDVQMPGLDGPQVLAALRAINPKVRAYFMTGDAGRYREDELLAMGARRVFAKPLDIRAVAAEFRGAASVGTGTSSRCGSPSWPGAAVAAPGGPPGPAVGR